MTRHHVTLDDADGAHASPQHAGGEEYEVDVLEVQCEGEDHHAQEGEDVHRERGHPAKQMHKHTHSSHTVELDLLLCVHHVGRKPPWGLQTRHGSWQRSLLLYCQDMSFRTEGGGRTYPERQRHLH